MRPCENKVTCITCTAFTQQSMQNMPVTPKTNKQHVQLCLLYHHPYLFPPGHDVRRQRRDRLVLPMGKSMQTKGTFKKRKTNRNNTVMVERSIGGGCFQRGSPGNRYGLIFAAFRENLHRTLTVFKLVRGKTLGQPNTSCQPRYVMGFEGKCFALSKALIITCNIVT